MSITLDGTSGITSPGLTNTGNETVSGTLTASGFNAASTFGFKNRIINGAMMIDQRNAGASGTATGYTVDRFAYQASQASKGTWQQNAGSVTPPAGFTKYLGFTSSSAYSVGASDYFRLYQVIEGLNCADLGWGAAGAATVTLSFWVRSSLTGTFGGTLENSGETRSYPFSYTISSANTWEQKTVTIAGDTSGTWLTTNGIGIVVGFSLGVGSTYSGASGSWAGAQYLGTTGTTSVVGTNGATFYITGVQLEKGSTATSFDYRPYGTELALCQRYYWKWSSADNNTSYSNNGWSYVATAIVGMINMPVQMRTNPTLSTSGTASHYRFLGTGPTSYTCNAVPVLDQSNVYSCNLIWYAATNPTVGQGVLCGANTTTSAYLGFSAEL